MTESDMLALRSGLYALTVGTWVTFGMLLIAIAAVPNAFSPRARAALTGIRNIALFLMPMYFWLLCVALMVLGY
jgi:hypothetical protein